MSFSFDFGGDDIDDGNVRIHDVADDVPNIPLETSSHQHAYSLDLRETLDSLPSQISYNKLNINEQSYVFRRSLFDIRAQLMAEAETGNSNDELLVGLDAGDLTSGTYEGGFKTWECAVDLADYVLARTYHGDWHVVELGAGSAVPSCALIAQVCRNKQSSTARHFHFTLCDYNADVLKLCTVPNVLLNAYRSHQGQADISDPDLELDHELDLEAVNAQSLIESLEAQDITFSLIGGGWGTQLAELALSRAPAASPPNLLVLASETIYSPQSTRLFSDTLISLLKSSAASATALIAAKQIYFGVGGSVADFTEEIRRRGAEVRKVAEITTAGVGRVVLEVTMTSRP